MNIIKNYIRNKLSDLIVWAIADCLYDIREAISKNAGRFETLQRTQNKQARAISMMANVAVDHHIRECASWAVVCTRAPNGRERVNFYRIQDEHADAVAAVLTNFKRDNVIIDCHPSVNNFFL